MVSNKWKEDIKSLKIETQEERKEKKKMTIVYLLIHLYEISSEIETRSSSQAIMFCVFGSIVHVFSQGFNYFFLFINLDKIKLNLTAFSKKKEWKEESKNNANG